MTSICPRYLPGYASDLAASTAPHANDDLFAIKKEHLNLLYMTEGGGKRSSRAYEAGGTRPKQSCEAIPPRGCHSGSRQRPQCTQVPNDGEINPSRRLRVRLTTAKSMWKLLRGCMENDIEQAQQDVTWVVPKYESQL